MILRDVIIADQARTLGRIPAPEPQRQDRPALAALLEPSHPAPSDVDARFNERPQSPVPAPLTFEQVAAWLAVQDGETREACASLLSEELTAVHETARQKGYEAGEKRALAESKQEIDRKLGALDAVTSAANTAFEQECAAVVENCADVVAEVLAKIAGPMLASREGIIGTVTTVLGRIKEDRAATIRVHTDDLPILQAYEQTLAQLLGSRKFSLVADARITVGGCIVETSLGSLDGRLEVQLREMCETLRSAKAASRESI
jgi:flagellar assembly protein FliH